MEKRLKADWPHPPEAIVARPGSLDGVIRSHSRSADPGYDVRALKRREPCPRPWVFIACQDYVGEAARVDQLYACHLTPRAGHSNRRRCRPPRTPAVFSFAAYRSAGVRFYDPAVNRSPRQGFHPRRAERLVTSLPRETGHPLILIRSCLLDTRTHLARLTSLRARICYALSLD